jgi:pilus assembly protein Flp/PilA
MSIEPLFAGLEGVMSNHPEKDGQGIIEYALIMIFVAVVVIIVMVFIGPSMGNVYSNIISAI